MIARAERTGVAWNLHYGGRRRSSMAFLDELTVFGDRIHLWPEDERGLVDLAGILQAPRPGTLIYCCGPESLLSAVDHHAARWPRGSVHVERFSARPPAAVGCDSPIEAYCQQSGITLHVPAGRTILSVAEEAGIPVMSGCREGVCGTCETRVLEGTPDHRDSLLSDEERDPGDHMMICVSRAVGERLTLDI